MGFYDLSKEERANLVNAIQEGIKADLAGGRTSYILAKFSDPDTYIRKAAYQAIGKLYKANQELTDPILQTLNLLVDSDAEKIRQTAINAAGEIGMTDFDPVAHFFDLGLQDPHHSVRNAVIGSVKKMGAKNPSPILAWAEQYLQHPDKEIRREICHGLELRGRTHPQDVLPLLEQLQFDQTARVRKTLIHVLGQISYKKGCLETVITGLKDWANQELVSEALDEIIDVHGRYRDFAVRTQKQATEYIAKQFKQGA